MEYKTQTRRLILDTLAENPDRIFKASEIAQTLSSVSLSTVYRSLDRLQKQGNIQVVGAAENNELRYRYTGPGKCESKLHLVCKKCGRFSHLEGSALQALIGSVFSWNGFVLDKQQSVLFGCCATCSAHK